MSAKVATRKGVWHEGTVGDVITLQRGFDITKAEQSDGLYPVISSSGPTSTHSAYKVEAPGVIIGRKGLLGGVYFSKTPFWPHDTTLWVKDFHSNDPKFVYYWLQTLGLEHYDVGASNPTLNRNHVHLLPTIIPDVETQCKIAAVLSAYDDLIEVNNQRIQILTEVVQRVYREWFVDFRYPGHKKIPLVGSELGVIPERWTVQSLPAMATVKYGKGLSLAALSDTGQYPVYGAGSIVGRYSAKTVSHRTILMVCRGAGCGALTITAPEAFVTNNSFMIDTADKEMYYLYLTLKSRGVAEFITGSAQPQITIANISQLRLVQPSTDVLDSFHEIVAAAFDLCYCLTAHIDTLRISRDLLLPRLISGEIDLTDIDVAMPQAAA